MTSDETLTLTLSEPLARTVRRAVEKGGYDGPQDVVAAALRVWIDRGSPPPMTTARLSELVDEAERSGEEDGDFDLDALLTEARASSKVR